LSKLRGCTEAHFNGRPITIRQAHVARPKGTYLCPECRNPVFAANLSSLRNAACFKHFEKPEKCDRYLGGDFIATDASEASPAVRLVLEVDETQTQGWRLFLQVPAADYSERGMIQAYTGPSLGLVEIPLSRVDLKSHDIALSPCFQPYGLDWVRGDDAQEYLATFEPRKRSVALHNPVTAFDVTQSGRSGRVDGQLYWSRSYYLVYGADHPIAAPLRPEPLSQKHDRRFEDWRCSRVVLPATPSESLRQWLLANIGLSVTAPPAKTTILYPFTIGLHQASQRVTHVESTARVLIAIEQPAEPSAELQCIVEQDAHTVAQPLPTETSFASIAAPPRGIVPLCFGADEDPSNPWYPLATLLPSATTRSGAVVYFEFEGFPVTAAHEPELLPRFSQARESRVALVAVRNPLGVKIVVESRAFPGSLWRQCPSTYDVAGIALLNVYIQDTNLELRITIAGMSTIELTSTMTGESALATLQGDPLLMHYGRFAHPSSRRGNSRLVDHMLTFGNQPIGVRARVFAGRGNTVK
jgi:hypothetical protein